MLQICPYCGVETPQESLYCAHCGKILPGKAWNKDAEIAAEKKKEAQKKDRQLKLLLGVIGGLLLFCVLFLIGAVIYSKHPFFAIEQTMSEADELFDKKDYLSASNRYQMVLSLDEDNKEAQEKYYKAQIYALAGEIAHAVSGESYKEASDCIGKKVSQKLLEEAKENGVSFPVIAETDYDKVGFYETTDGDYIAYCGAYDKDVRSGKGVLIAAGFTDYSQGEISEYAAVCSFADDVPQGDAKVLIWKNSYKQYICTGIVKDGLWDGTMTFDVCNDDETDYTFQIDYKAGIEQVIEEKTVDGEKVYRISNYQGEDIFLYEHESNLKLTFGILGYGFCIL